MCFDPLAILCQDEWIVAVDKPAGQLVDPAQVPQEGDEVTVKILRDQIGQRVRVIHRLDRPTSGMLLFAKEKNAARRLQQAFEKHEMDKTYWAVVTGHPVSERWICRRGIRKDGHPIVGDYWYLGEERCDELGVKLGTGTRMLLQAKSLRLVHPMMNADLLI